MIDGEDDVIVEGVIVNVLPTGDGRYRVMLHELYPHTLLWDCELPLIEYQPRVSDKMAIQFRLIEGFWRIFFKLRSGPWGELTAPWIELKALW